jgi:hypothetical protein
MQYLDSLEQWQLSYRDDTTLASDHMSCACKSGNVHVGILINSHDLCCAVFSISLALYILTDLV